VSWILTIWIFGSLLVFLLTRVLGGEVLQTCCFIFYILYSSLCGECVIYSLLWSPYGIGRPLYFCPVICSFFFPCLISAITDWMSAILHTWCGLSANLRCRSETCCMRLTENTERKKWQKFAIWAPSHNFVGLYLHN